MTRRASTPPRIKVNGRIYVRADAAPVVMDPTTTAVANALDGAQAQLEQLNRAFHHTQPQPHAAPLVTAEHAPDLLRLATGLHTHAQALIDALQQVK